MVIAVEISERISSQRGDSGSEGEVQLEDNRVYDRSDRTHTASMMIYKPIAISHDLWRLGSHLVPM